jgi:hypothetical protein
MPRKESEMPSVFFDKNNRNGLAQSAEQGCPQSNVIFGGSSRLRPRCGLGAEEMVKADVFGRRGSGLERVGEPTG